MSKSLTRTLYLVGLVLEAVGALFTVLGLRGTGTPFLLIGIPVVAIASILLTVVWISALVKTLQLRRWLWFVCLLVFSGLALLLYVFIGPQQPPTALQERL